MALHLTHRSMNVFNEYNVQIKTLSYIAGPAEPQGGAHGALVWRSLRKPPRDQIAERESIGSSIAGADSPKIQNRRAGSGSRGGYEEELEVARRKRSFP